MPTIELSCETCTHIKMCILIRIINKAVQDHYKQNETPIIPQNIATICKQYTNEKIFQEYKNALPNQQQDTNNNNNPSFL